MKRALSLIIVLAMVLCMIPFSAFAADFGTAEDFADGSITLSGYEANSYLWTATEDGTLEITAEGAEGTAIYILVDDDDYSELYAETGLTVVAGKSYEITIGDDNGVGGEVLVNTFFKGLPGTETNPYEIYNPASGMGDGNTTTVEVAAGESVFYNLHCYAGSDVTITGNGVKVAKGEDVVDGTEAGYVTFTFAGNDRTVLIKITNKSDAPATYVVTAVQPNSINNPDVVTAGEHTANLDAGNQGYYYSYTAEGDGTVEVGVSAVDAEGNPIGWSFSVNNVTTYIYGDTQSSDMEGYINPYSVNVSAGDVIEIMASTYDPANMWNAPAGTVTTTITFVEAGAEEPDVPGALVLGDNSLAVANGATNTYTYTPEMDGVLTVAATALDPAAGNIGMIFGMGNMVLTVDGAQAMGPSIEANVTAGTPVTVTLANYMGQDETVTLNLAIAEPAGPGESEETAIEIELPWTLTMENAHDMYYKYTATADCIVKVTNTGHLGISGVESKSYDENTKYVELVAGDVIIINAYAYDDGSYTYTAEVVDALPAGNGTYDFPIVIDAVPYEATNSGERTLYYSYTAAKAGTLVFTGTGDYYVTLNGGWSSALDAEGKVVVAAGDEISISTYPTDSFTVDYVPMVAKIGDQEFLTVADALAVAGSGDVVEMIADSHEEGSNLVLEEGVTLNIGANDLYVKGIVGYAGSSLLMDEYRTSIDHGVLHVTSKNRLVLTDCAVYDDGDMNANTLSYLPVWDENTKTYVMAGSMLPTSTYDDSYTTEDILDFRFAPAFRKDSKNAFFLNGMTDNGLTLVLKLTWEIEGLGEIGLDFTYFDSFVIQQANGGGKYQLTLPGYSNLNIELAKLTITPMIISDTGFVLYGVDTSIDN